MIQNDEQLKTTLERIAWFQQQVAQLRKTETNPANLPCLGFRLSRRDRPHAVTSSRVLQLTPVGTGWSGLARSRPLLNHFSHEFPLSLPVSERGASPRGP
jgi:hypothetical protein